MSVVSNKFSNLGFEYSSVRFLCQIRVFSLKGPLVITEHFFSDFPTFLRNGVKTEIMKHYNDTKCSQNISGICLSGMQEKVSRPLVKFANPTFGCVSD